MLDPTFDIKAKVMSLILSRLQVDRVTIKSWRLYCYALK